MQSLGCCNGGSIGSWLLLSLLASGVAGAQTAPAPKSLVTPAQTAPAPKKLVTPAQTVYQQAWRDWFAKYGALRQTAEQALAAEQAREKTGDCANADTTIAAEQCLAREIATTQSNYARVTGALRAMLALPPPEMPCEPVMLGPTGTSPTPAERLAAFDALETASAAYRKLAAGVAFDEFKGGTLAPVFSLEAEQKLLRSHLSELAFLYDTEFSDR